MKNQGGLRSVRNDPIDAPSDVYESVSSIKTMSSSAPICKYLSAIISILKFQYSGHATIGNPLLLIFPNICSKCAKQSSASHTSQ